MEALNGLLHEYRAYNRQDGPAASRKGISIISIAMDSDQDTISAFGKAGALEGVSTKTIYSSRLRCAGYGKDFQDRADKTAERSGEPAAAGDERMHMEQVQVLPAVRHTSSKRTAPTA